MGFLTPKRKNQGSEIGKTFLVSQQEHRKPRSEIQYPVFVEGVFNSDTLQSKKTLDFFS